MKYHNLNGVPDYLSTEFAQKHCEACLLIPIINEGERILTQLCRAQAAGVPNMVDIIICDGGSTDKSTDPQTMAVHGVNTLLVKYGEGRQGAQLRTGLHFAFTRGYRYILTIDGNNKDSIEDVPLFLQKLAEGYDYVQGSRFLAGGVAENTPLIRDIAVRFLHAPVISFTAKTRLTDTTNNFRGYSAAYLQHPDVQPLRDIFSGYELLAYLSTRAGQLGLKVCEVPVARRYPKAEPTPTKISGFAGYKSLLDVLFQNAKGAYLPPK